MISQKKSFFVALLAVFTAITVVLQMLSYSVKIGTFNLSLVLIPIVLSGILYGYKFSSFLGGVFGLVTYIAAFVGIDAGGHILFEASPLLLLVLCLSKGILAGFISGIVATAFSKKNTVLKTVIPAMLAPLVNTGVFLICAFLFFKDTLYSWAGGNNIAFYVITGLVGINFVIEFLINIILSPVLVRIIGAVKRYK